MSSDISKPNNFEEALSCEEQGRNSIYLESSQMPSNTVTKKIHKFQRLYRVSHLVADLGFVDLDFGSSPGWWASTLATHCPGRVVEHPKSKSTQPRSATR